MIPRGIVHITGEPDTGKTLLALTAYDPKKTAYFFDDVKAPALEPKEFGLFVDLVNKYSAKKMLEFYAAIKAEIDAIPAGKFEAIVWDTWARTGKSIRYYAKANPLEFREGKTFSAMGQIRGAEEWGETHRVEMTSLSTLSQKCTTLFLVTHIKPQIRAGVQTGSYEPDCGKSFDRVCNLRLWLRHNPHGSVPIALVLKRIAKIEVSKGKVTPVNVLPRKLTPVKADNTTWDAIDRYWDNPVGNREPTADEIPTPFELSILDGVLTPDQKEMWQAELRAKQQQEEEERQLFRLAAKEQVQELAKSGKPAPVILNLLKDEYPQLTSNDVAEMMK